MRRVPYHYHYMIAEFLTAIFVSLHNEFPQARSKNKTKDEIYPTFVFASIKAKINVLKVLWISVFNIIFIHFTIFLYLEDTVLVIDLSPYYYESNNIRCSLVVVIAVCCSCK